MNKQDIDADYLIEQGEYAPAVGIAMSVVEVIYYRIVKEYTNPDDWTDTLDFEKEILDIYHEYVKKEALKPNSSAYDCVACMLRHMRTFNGGNAIVDQLLREYRNTYKRRKNMMAALENV